MQMCVTMSRFKLELCSCVVKENYGELVEKVAMFIAKNGPSQLKTVIKHTECNVKQVSSIFASYAIRGKGYFAECGLRNAESCQRVICGKFDANISAE